MTTFTEILQRAREDIKKSYSVKKEDTVIKAEKTLEETNINTPIQKENKTEDKLDNSFITIGDAIIEQSIVAMIGVKKSKLRSPCGASRRIAKSIAAKNIKLSQLNKAFDIQKRYGNKRPEWYVVGGHALNQLRKLLDNGKPLNEALNTRFERN